MCSGMDYSYHLSCFHKVSFSKRDFSARTLACLTFSNHSYGFSSRLLVRSWRTRYGDCSQCLLRDIFLSRKQATLRKVGTSSNPTSLRESLPAGCLAALCSDEWKHRSTSGLILFPGQKFVRHHFMLSHCEIKESFDTLITVFVIHKTKMRYWGFFCHKKVMGELKGHVSSPIFWCTRLTNARKCPDHVWDFIFLLSRWRILG